MKETLARINLKKWIVSSIIAVVSIFLFYFQGFFNPDSLPGIFFLLSFKFLACISMLSIIRFTGIVVKRQVSIETREEMESFFECLYDRIGEICDVNPESNLFGYPFVKYYKRCLKIMIFSTCAFSFLFFFFTSIIVDFRRMLEARSPREMIDIISNDVLILLVMLFMTGCLIVPFLKAIATFYSTDRIRRKLGGFLG